MLQEFRDFIFRGNALALAIGVMVAGAFQKIVDALIENLLNPIIGALVGGNDLSNALRIVLSKTTGPDGKVVENAIGIGAILATLISFVLTMVVLYILAKTFAKDALKK